VTPTPINILPHQPHNDNIAQIELDNNASISTSESSHSSTLSNPSHASHSVTKETPFWLESNRIIFHNSENSSPIRSINIQMSRPDNSTEQVTVISSDNGEFPETPDMVVDTSGNDSDSSITTQETDNLGKQLKVDNPLPTADILIGLDSIDFSVLTTLETDSTINFSDSITTTSTQTTVLNIPDCIPHVKLQVDTPHIIAPITSGFSNRLLQIYVNYLKAERLTQTAQHLKTTEWNMFSVFSSSFHILKHILHASPIKLFEKFTSFVAKDDLLHAAFRNTSGIQVKTCQQDDSPSIAHLIAEDTVADQSIFDIPEIQIQPQDETVKAKDNDIIMQTVAKEAVFLSDQSILYKAIETQHEDIQDISNKHKAIDIPDAHFIAIKCSLHTKAIDTQGPISNPDELNATHFSKLKSNLSIQDMIHKASKSLVHSISKSVYHSICCNYNVPTLFPCYKSVITTAYGIRRHIPIRSWDIPERQH